MEGTWWKWKELGGSGRNLRIWKEMDGLKKLVGYGRNLVDMEGTWWIWKELDGYGRNWMDRT